LKGARGALEFHLKFAVGVESHPLDQEVGASG